jgi:hypothetical protein
LKLEEYDLVFFTNELNDDFLALMKFYMDRDKGKKHFLGMMCGRNGALEEEILDEFKERFEFWGSCFNTLPNSELIIPRAKFYFLGIIGQPLENLCLFSRYQQMAGNSDNSVSRDNSLFVLSGVYNLEGLNNSSEIKYKGFWYLFNVNFNRNSGHYLENPEGS